MDNANNNRSVGAYYEDMAARYLQDKGYIILDRNYRYKKSYEIDIVARDKETIVFIEVKYRTGETKGHPLESVNFSKQRRICRAADIYINHHRLSMEQSYRFDVIGITRDCIDHIENAFEYMGV